LDISDALVYYGLRLHVPPSRLLQSIASHLVGRSAFNGGLRDAMLGLALHYLIAAFWISTFVISAQFFEVLFRRPIISGAIYGLVIYGVMNFLILPHTHNSAPLSRDPFNLLNGIFALVIFMGIFVALCNQCFAPNDESSTISWKGNLALPSSNDSNTKKENKTNRPSSQLGSTSSQSSTDDSRSHSSSANR
jgi:uncharacterized membrane protein YagU involved in acid resistance